MGVPNHMIDTDKTISQNYNELLRRKRQIELQHSTGDVWCKRCKRLKKEHLPDSRCDTFATSGEFYSEYTEEMELLNQSLEAIEFLLNQVRVND